MLLVSLTSEILNFRDLFVPLQKEDKNMTKKELIAMFVKNKINPSIKNLTEFLHWINYNPDEENEKVEFLSMYLSNGIEISISEMNNIFKWATEKSPDAENIIKSDDISIETFIEHMRDELFENSPSIFTRTSKWIIEKGFENVPQLAEFGSQRMKREFNIGEKSVVAVRNNLAKFYGISKW